MSAFRRRYQLDRVIEGPLTKLIERQTGKTPPDALKGSPFHRNRPYNHREQNAYGIRPSARLHRRVMMNVPYARVEIQGDKYAEIELYLFGGRSSGHLLSAWYVGSAC
jgi:hypothetical protein